METGYGFGLPLVVAGPALLPIGAATAVFSPVSARLSERFGARTTLVTGTVVLVAGNLGMASLPGELVLVIAAALAQSALPRLTRELVPAA